MLFSENSKMLSITFQSQIDSQTKRQNSIIKAYLRVFINWKQNDWAKLLSMAEFTNNNAKNASTSHSLFELNCGYHPRDLFENDINPCLKFRFTNKLAKKLKKLIDVYFQNLFHTRDLSKKPHEKRVKSRSYISNKNIWLNSKYIKTKKNKKLENKFLRLF